MVSGSIKKYALMAASMGLMTDAMTRDMEYQQCESKPRNMKSQLTPKQVKARNKSKQSKQARRKQR